MTKEITKDEATALLRIRGGCDVYDYSLARTLRGLQRNGLGDLLDICNPQMYRGDGTDQVPYFGAIATEKGIRIANKILGKGKVVLRKKRA